MRQPHRDADPLNAVSKPTVMAGEIARQLRELGPVLDMPATRALYDPLLEHQPRDGARVTRDLVYGADVRHRLDLYEPEGHAAGTTPVLMVFHGGGFIRGDKSERENAGFYFARAGFTVVVPNYRLAPAHRWPAGAEDVVAALTWMKSRLQAQSATPPPVFLIGESAGAAHVGTAVLLRRFQRTGGPATGLGIAGAVLVSGVYNVHMEKLARRQLGVATPDPRNEAYYGSDFAQYPSLSVIDLIDAAPLPLLITWAELDLIQMQIQGGELFSRLVTKHGFAPEVAMIRNHNHLSQVHSVNTGDEALSGPILRFIKGVLGQ
jgi:acetyl esterase